MNGRRVRGPGSTGRRGPRFTWLPSRLATGLPTRLVGLLAAFATMHLAAEARQPATSSSPDGRIVRHFDFEELELVPVRLPRPWQNLADELGLPRFGDWAVRNDQAAGGRWSLRLDPDGVPMAFGIPSGVVLVYPMTDYRVRCRVRTEGLAHGRAQLVAMLCDAAGDPIEESIARSPAVRSPDRWSTVEVTTRGAFPEAVSLRVELHLLQPRRIDPDADPVAAAQPTLVDVTGSAWFDDVVIEHRSRVELSTNGNAGVITAPFDPTLSVAVHDLTTAGLAGDLTVRDADGRVVHVERIDRLQAGAIVNRRLPLDRYGWYEARLDVHIDGEPVGDRSIAFAWVPSLRRFGAEGTGRIGVTVDTEELAPGDDLTGLITATGASSAVLPVWPTDDPIVAAMPAVIDRLMDRGVDVVAELAGIRTDRAAAAGLDSHQVAEFLAAGPDGWRADLEPLVIAFGLRVARWTIGPRRIDDPRAPPVSPDAVAGATARLASALPAPIAVFPVDAPLDDGRTGATETLARIPAEARPDAMDEWIEDHLTAVELSLPTDLNARDAEIDLALRLLYAWRAGVNSATVALPTFRDHEDDGPLMPGRLLPALRVLADGLQGRRVVGTLRLGEDVEAWLLGGQSPEDGAVVMWRPGRAGDAASNTSIRLGSGPIEQVGLRGDRRPVGRDDLGRHVIAVGPRPSFIEGVDLDMLRFRAALAIVPDEVPAVYRAHELELVVTNPWDVAIAGLVAIEDDPGRRIQPLRVPFTLQPGETLRRPLTVVFDRVVSAGIQEIPAIVTVEAIESDRFEVNLPVTVGWKEIDITATWRIDVDPETGRRDLIVRQYVTNRGDTSVQLDAFLRGPGLGRDRRPLEKLTPGATAARTFRIANGVELLSGEVLRYGVSERGGPAQLNRPLPIPMLVPVSATASVPTP